MKPVICLMGPTASGKTALAIELVQRHPCQIISVDSACVYRGMDIGTSKPDAATQIKAPHWLIDICDPSEPYSAGEFRRDALKAIEKCHSENKIPLLVGGTMLYFRVLQQGLATLPHANSELREELTKQAENIGWEKMHTQLKQIDAIAAERINPNDSQRIARALEVYQLTGKTITDLHQESTESLSEYKMINLALMPEDRAELHLRIAERFKAMLQAGLIDEVQALYERGNLHLGLPSIRSVGYKQVWEYLAGVYDKEEMTEKAIAATRQLAKRQITWLRSWPQLHIVKSMSDIELYF